MIVVNLCTYTYGALRKRSRKGPFCLIDCMDRENRSAKFWLDPDVTLADNYGYSRKELRDIERMIRENLEVLKNEWDAFCGGTHTG